MLTITLALLNGAEWLGSPYTAFISANDEPIPIPALVTKPLLFKTPIDWTFCPSAVGVTEKFPPPLAAYWYWTEESPKCIIFVGSPSLLKTSEIGCPTYIPLISKSLKDIWAKQVAAASVITATIADMKSFLILMILPL